MTYETVVPELFERLPYLRSAYETQFEYMGDEPPLNYIVFGSVLVPALETALGDQKLSSVTSICSFLEDASQSSQKDARLRELLVVEIGEWLGWAKNEELLATYLGPETKRICEYVPGLSTQRLRLKADRQKSSLKSRVSSFFKGGLSHSTASIGVSSSQPAAPSRSLRHTLQVRPFRSFAPGTSDPLGLAKAPSPVAQSHESRN
jgi:hypothetical protein